MVQKHPCWHGLRQAESLQQPKTIMASDSLCRLNLQAWPWTVYKDSKQAWPQAVYKYSKQSWSQTVYKDSINKPVLRQFINTLNHHGLGQFVPDSIKKPGLRQFIKTLNKHGLGQFLKTLNKHGLGQFISLVLIRRLDWLQRVSFWCLGVVSH